MHSSSESQEHCFKNKERIIADEKNKKVYSGIAVCGINY